MIKKKPLQLAIIYTDLSLGGIQRKIIDLLNYIHKTKLRQRLDTEVILRWKTDFDLIPNLTYKKQKIFYPPRIFPFPRRRMPFFFNILFRFIVNPPNIILTHVFSSSMRSVPLARLMFGKKVRIVISQDNIFSYENNQWYARLLVSTIYPMADAIIVQTNISRDDLVNNWNIPASKISVIPNWSRNITLKEKKDRDIDIIYCGRFEDQKNLLRLLKICKFLIKQKSDLKVVIIGSGRQESLLKDYASQNGLNSNVSFLVPTNDIDNYLGRAKIFALTSKFEGQPMALLEAMNYGCVPVLIDFPGANEYISHNVNGLIAKSDKVFASYVFDCLNDKKLSARLALASKKTVEKKYSEKNIKKYLDLMLQDLKL